MLQPENLYQKPFKSLTVLGEKEQWFSFALNNHAQIYIEQLSRRFTKDELESEEEKSGSSRIQLGPLIHFTLNRMIQRIQAMTVYEQTGERGGEYAAFLTEFIAEIEACDAKAKALYKIQLAYLNNVLYDEGVNLEQSKEKVISYYKYFFSRNSFYGSAEYEGHELACELGIHLIVETHNEIELVSSFNCGLALSENIPKITLYRFQSTDPNHQRSNHFNLHTVNDELIPHSILGTGNCLFDAIAQALLEMFLMQDSADTAETRAKRRRSQTLYGIATQNLPENTPLPHLPLSSSTESVEVNDKIFLQSTSEEINAARVEREKSVETRREQDISTLILAFKFIQSVLLANTLEIKDLHQLGDFFQKICWKEDDPVCIRNKHGYRSRYKPDANKLNTKGARLNFEQLARLIHYPDDEQYAQLLLENHIDCIASLKIIVSKLQFIFISEQAYLTKEQRTALTTINFSEKQNETHSEDKLAIEVLASFTYDYICLTRLIANINHFTDDNYENLDLSDRINCYRLAYLFSLMGETAKELSDYIKPEKSGIKTMFGKLGKYRDEIKTHPSIVCHNNTSRLENMRSQFLKVKDPLLLILRDLAIQLKLCYESKNLGNFRDHSSVRVIISKYHDQCNVSTISTITEELSIGKSDIQKKLESLRRQLDGISKEEQEKLDEGKTAKKEKKYQHIEGLRQKVPRLQKELVEVEARLSQPLIKGNTSPEITTLLTTAFETKKAKQLIGLCQFASNEQIEEKQHNFTIAQKSLIRLLNRRFLETDTKKRDINGDSKKFLVLVKQLPSYQFSLNQKIQQASLCEINDSLDYIKLFDTFSTVDVTFERRHDEICKNRIISKLKVAEKELQEAIALQKKYEELAQNEAAHEQYIHRHLLEYQKIVFKASKEIEFLQEVFLLLQEAFIKGDEKRIQALIMTEKMSFGFLGQLNKELMDEKNKTQLIAANFLSASIDFLQGKDSLGLAKLELLLVKDYQTMLEYNVTFIMPFLSALCTGYIENGQLDSARDCLSLLDDFTKTHFHETIGTQEQVALYFQLMKATPTVKYRILEALLLSAKEGRQEKFKELLLMLDKANMDSGSFGYLQKKGDFRELEKVQLLLFSGLTSLENILEGCILEDDYIGSICNQIVVYHLSDFPEASNSSETDRLECQSMLYELSQELTRKILVKAMAAYILGNIESAQKLMCQSVLSKGLVAYLYNQSIGIIELASTVTSPTPISKNEIIALPLNEWREKTNTVDLKEVYIFLQSNLPDIKQLTFYRNILGEYLEAIETKNDIVLQKLILDRQRHLQSVLSFDSGEQSICLKLSNTDERYSVNLANLVKKPSTGSSVKSTKGAVYTFGGFKPEILLRQKSKFHSSDTENSEPHDQKTKSSSSRFFSSPATESDETKKTTDVNLPFLPQC